MLIDLIVLERNGAWLFVKKCCVEHSERTSGNTRDKIYKEIKMQIKNSESRFGMIAILLHWAMALLMIGLVVLGLYMKRVPVGLFKLKLYGWHKEYGILILMLAIARLAWRLTNVNPSLAMLSRFEIIAARAVHWAFYGFMFALPITGWMMTSAAGLAPSFFGLFTLPNIIAPDNHLRILLKEIHEWLAYGLIFTFCGHVGAALKHHFINHDNILRRML